MDAATLARRLAARGFDVEVDGQSLSVSRLHPAHVNALYEIRKAVREEAPGAREVSRVRMYGRRDGEPDATHVRFECSGRPDGGPRAFLPAAVGI